MTIVIVAAATKIATPSWMMTTTREKSRVK
ncbi:hypothetical protein A2U01_0038864, partial [Trifolium medium]|nr:hypothetical protein [Trifolium medium]